MTKQADYGIVLLTRMAAGSDRLFTTTELAAETGLPQPTVSKILKQLGRSGLLESQRGVKGGYALRGEPATISVAQIISALEGPISITECIDDTPGECDQEPICPVRGNWQRINDAVRDALEAVTLDQMARPAGPAGLVTLGSGRSAQPAERA